VTSPLRIAFVPGVTLTKWTRAWEERRRGTPLEFVPTDDPAGALTRDEADVAFARLPLASDGLSVIRLYSEAHVVVVSADDPIKAMDEVVLADLDGYTLHDPFAVVEDTIALVAAGVGAVVLPHAIARAHARKDLISRPVTDAPETDIAIAWLEDAETPDIEEFVGIVRGRSANSSRGSSAPAAAVAAPEAKPAKGGPVKQKQNAGGKAVSKRKPYANSGTNEFKNRSGSPNSPKARAARKRKGR
jgi:DNA-binding transcriptional LysR family regulator